MPMLRCIADRTQTESKICPPMDIRVHPAVIAWLVCVRSARGPAIAGVPSLDPAFTGPRIRSARANAAKSLIVSGLSRSCWRQTGDGLKSVRLHAALARAEFAALHRRPDADRIKKPSAWTRRQASFDRDYPRRNLDPVFTERGIAFASRMEAKTCIVKSLIGLYARSNGQRL